MEQAELGIVASVGRSRESDPRSERIVGQRRPSQTDVLVCIERVSRACGSASIRRRITAPSARVSERSRACWDLIRVFSEGLIGW